MSTKRDIATRFSAAWAVAQAEHARVERQYGAGGVPDNDPRWGEYERLSAAAEAIADEAGPRGSEERAAVVYTRPEYLTD